MKLLFNFKSFLYLICILNTPAQMLWADVYECPTPNCITVPSVRECTAAYVDGALCAREALKENPTQISNAWDQKMLAINPQLKRRLNDYLKRNIANSIRALDLNLPPERLHQALLQRGFIHTRKPLAHFISGQQVFIHRSGKLTPEPDNDAVIHDIYIHPDGGMVRMKPEGVPLPAKDYKRRYPQISLSVLLHIPPDNHDAHQYDTSYGNEAFKVTAKGIPIPKSPNPAHGFNLRPKNFPTKTHHQKAYVEGWIETLMEAVHLELAVELEHCQAA